MVEGKETTEADESRCDKALRPFEINYCRLPCPGHCVVTNWSAWSRCSQVEISTQVIAACRIDNYKV